MASLASKTSGSEIGVVSKFTGTLALCNFSVSTVSHSAGYLLIKGALAQISDFSGTIIVIDGIMPRTIENFRGTILVKTSSGKYIGREYDQNGVTVSVPDYPPFSFSLGTAVDGKKYYSVLSNELIPAGVYRGKELVLPLSEAKYSPYLALDGYVIGYSSSMIINLFKLNGEVIGSGNPVYCTPVKDCKTYCTFENNSKKTSSTVNLCI